MALQRTPLINSILSCQKQYHDGAAPALQQMLSHETKAMVAPLTEPWPPIYLEMVVIPAAQKSSSQVCCIQRGHVVPGASHPLQSSFHMGEILSLSPVPRALGLRSKEEHNLPFVDAVLQRVECDLSIFSNQNRYHFELSPIHIRYVHSTATGFISPTYNLSGRITQWGDLKRI